MAVLDTPTHLILTEEEATKAEPHLKYRDLRVQREYLKLKNASWFINRHGEEAWRDKLSELKEKMDVTLLEREEGRPRVLSGLGQMLYDKVGIEVENGVIYPPPSPVPWVQTFEPRPYQEPARDALLSARHGAVEIGTGLGKSRIVAMILKDLGLPSLVMVPSVSIHDQLVADLRNLLGKKMVGSFGDGKKDLGKLVTVGIAASLRLVKKDTPAWEDLSSRKVFIADESHLCPADTLQEVCLGLTANAPYRFFLSGTQTRQDGLSKVLLGITGPVVYDMSVAEGVSQGWLAEPRWCMASIRSRSTVTHREAVDENREHLLRNPVAAAAIAEFANRSVALLNRPTLILVEEVGQFASLLPHFKHKAAFAHGGVTKDNQDKVPKEYWKSDPTSLVASFNEGKIPILVGTSCIGTGTDVRQAWTLCLWQGGKSGNKVRQAVGRGTRGGSRSEVYNPWTGKKKLDVLVFDLDVENVGVLHSQAESRRDIYRSIWESEIKEIRG